MNEEIPDVAAEVSQTQTPPDVAVLFAWAKIEGVPYRDFSHARRLSRDRNWQRLSSSRPQVPALPQLTPAEPASPPPQLQSSPSLPEIVPANPSLATPSLAPTHDDLSPQRFPARRHAPNASQLLSPGPQPALRAPFPWQGSAPQPALREPDPPLIAHSSRARSHLRNALIRPDAPSALAQAPPQVAAPIAEVSADPPSTARRSVLETLQSARERLGSRWHALRSMHARTPETASPHALRQENVASRIVIVSAAGGVGNTSLTAALGRVFSSAGERTLLVDLNPFGLLPFYFGATELRPGALRTFAPARDTPGTPITLLSCEIAKATQHTPHIGLGYLNAITDKLTFDRVLFDAGVSVASASDALASEGGLVLVLLAPDMNAVIRLGALDRLLTDTKDAAGRPVSVRYLLTQFDASLPLHLDLREALAQKLGDRLLPFVIRRSAAVAEALADGMTVLDYAPHSEAAADYKRLADFLKTLTEPEPAETRSVRWSER